MIKQLLFALYMHSCHMVPLTFAYQPVAPRRPDRRTALTGSNRPKIHWAARGDSAFARLVIFLTAIPFRDRACEMICSASLAINNPCVQKSRRGGKQPA
ncbi:hypothetical protein B0H21DRAFT_42130 [Amylocystis lapponica]|nr:hypothetical protein B0H21DRAFT_42130 [Amylocystis lapponica]